MDGSARVQTVSTVDNPEFHALLGAVGASTGREMVLNTSFNVKGQAIVNTPAEAVETFLGTRDQGAVPGECSGAQALSRESAGARALTDSRLARPKGVQCQTTS